MHLLKPPSWVKLDQKESHKYFSTTVGVKGNPAGKSGLIVRESGTINSLTLKLTRRYSLALSRESPKRVGKLRSLG
jgi:hypothetical protein